MYRSDVIRRIFVSMAVIGLVGSCGAPTASPPSIGPTPTPEATPLSSSSPGEPSATPVAAAVDIHAFDATARTFVDTFNANWADAPAAFAGFTEDGVVIDPSNADFTIGPGADLVQSWAGFASDFPQYRATTTAVYVSGVAGAFLTEVAGLPVTTSDRLFHELRVFRFTDGTASRASALELWYRTGDLQAGGPARHDCVAPDRCLDDVRPFADAYLAAWTSAEPSTFTALYRGDATVTDVALGIHARGANEIGLLAKGHLGGTTAGCAVRETYVQTDDGDPATTDNTDPKGGTVAGIAIVFRCERGAGTISHVVDGVTLLVFGARQPHSFDNDPAGRIVSEEVLYDAAGLAAAGLIP